MDIKYVCSSCFKIYAHATSLSRHVNIYHRNRRHTCSICQLGFKRVESLRTHERRIHGKTGDNPNPSNRQTTVTAPLNTAISEEVFQTPTFELTCTGNLSIHDRLGTNSIQPIEEKTYLQDPVEEDMDFLEDIFEGAQIFVDECAKEEQIRLNKDSLPQTQAILHNNWETPQCTRKRTNCTTTTNALFSLVTNYTNMLITTKENNTFCNLKGSEFISSIPNKTLYSENELQCSSLPQSAPLRHYRHLYRRGNSLKGPAIDCQTRNFFTYRVGLPNKNPLHSLTNR